MKKINLKEFEFDKKLLENVKLFDVVLKELDEPPLFENQNFEIVTDFKIFPNSLVMQNTADKDNALPIMIWFESEDLRIDIEMIPETFDWAKKHIDEDKNSVIELIRNLFTGYILMDYRGTSARFVQIFDADGHFVMSFSSNVLLHFFGRYLLRQKDYRRLFLPIFKKTK